MTKFLFFVGGGTVTVLQLSMTENQAVWARLPLTAPTALTAGAYWIGLLSSADVSCFAVESTPAALDAYPPTSAQLLIQL